MEKNIIFCLIGIILTTTIWWLIGSFISMNLTWFIDSITGRIIAIILLILTLSINLKEL